MREKNIKEIERRRRRNEKVLEGHDAAKRRKKSVSRTKF